MGEWFQYSMRFANKQGRLSDRLVEMGLAERQPKVLSDGRNVTEYRIFLDRFENYIGEEARKIFSHEFSLDPPLTSLVIGEEENGNIYYVNKWAPNDSLSIAIGKAVGIDKENIVETTCSYTGGFQYIRWYEWKDGQCTKDGSPVYGMISSVNKNLLKEVGNEYQVRLPIGDENARWGSFTVPKGNITFGEWADEEGNAHRYGFSVFFSEKEIPVTFYGRKVNMTPKEISDKYYDSKENFRREMSKPVKIEVSSDKVTRKASQDGGYFIVKVPCTREMSENMELSVTSGLFGVRNAGNGNYVVQIGNKGCTRGVFVVENGSRVRKELKAVEIRDGLLKAMAECSRGYSRELREQADIEKPNMPYVEESLNPTRNEDLDFNDEEIPF